MSNKTHKKIYYGGKKLGQGSYGCVVTPPLKCKNTQLLRRNVFNINENFISKIIKTKFSIEAFTELNIGIKVYNLDLESKYFVPFINACYFKPQKHQDIIYLSTISVKLASTVTEDTAIFSPASILPAPPNSALPPTSKVNFVFYVNGVYIPNHEIISFTDNGNNTCTLVIDPNLLGYYLTGKEITAIGKFL
jgi:hypothetical protein